MNQDGHPLLTLAEAAAYMRVHRRTMTRLLRDGQVLGVKIGRQWRVRKVDLEAYFNVAVSTATHNAPDQEPAGQSPR